MGTYHVKTSVSRMQLDPLVSSLKSQSHSSSQSLVLNFGCLGCPSSLGSVGGRYALISLFPSLMPLDELNVQPKKNI